MGKLSDELDNFYGAKPFTEGESDPVSEAGQRVADALQPTLSGVARGVTGIAGMPGDILKLTEYVSQFVADKLGLGNVGKFETSFLPTSSRYQELIKEGIGDYLTRDADTTVGRMIQRPVELATGGGGAAAAGSKLLQSGLKTMRRPGAANIKPLVSSKEGAKVGAVAGTAGQGAREFYDGDMGETVGTGLELGLTFGRAGSQIRPEYASRQARAIIDETEKVDPNLRQARAYEQAGNELGIPLTTTEIVQSPTATRQTGNILNQPTTSGRFGTQELEAQRSGLPNISSSNVQRAVNEAIDRRGDPVGFANQIKKAAQNIIQKAAANRTEKTRALFEAGVRDKIKADDVGKLVKQVDEAMVDYGVDDPIGKGLAAIRAALTRTKEISDQYDPMVAPVTKPKLVGDAKTLYNVYRSFRERLDAPMDSKLHIPDAKDGIIAPILTDIRNLALKNSRAVRTGHKEYQRISRETIDPLNEGALGRMTRLQNQDAMFDIFKAGDSVSVKEFADVSDLLIRENPKLYKTMAKEWLHRAFEKAATPNLDEAGAVNFKAGAKFDKAVRGAAGSDQRRKFDLLMFKLAKANGRKFNRNELHSGFSRLMDVLARTAKIPNLGSPTAGRAQDFKESGRSMIGYLNITNSEIFREWADVVSNKQFGKLADALGTKGGLDALIKLGKERPTSKRIGSIMTSLFTSLDAADPED